MDTNRLAQQHAKNAAGLEKMAAKARATGKKVGGYTLTELEQHAAEYRRLADSNVLPAATVRVMDIAAAQAEMERQRG